MVLSDEVNPIPKSLIDGAGYRIRTRGPLITNQVLYQLSYKGNNCPTSRFYDSVKGNPCLREQVGCGSKRFAAENVLVVQGLYPLARTAS